MVILCSFVAPRALELVKTIDWRCQRNVSIAVAVTDAQLWRVVFGFWSESTGLEFGLARIEAIQVLLIRQKEGMWVLVGKVQKSVGSGD